MPNPNPGPPRPDLDLVTEREIDGHVYTLYHADSGDSRRGFGHAFYIARDGVLHTIRGNPHAAVLVDWDDPEELWRMSH